jgi:MFS family permease
MTHNRLHGYAIVSVVFLSAAIGIGTAQYAFGLFISPLEETFGWTRTEISASLSFAAVGGLTAPLIGRAMDRFGARPILTLSLLVAGLGLILRPFMYELWHWYALSFLQFATFAGMTVLPAGKLIAAWYPHARGKMLGIAAMGNNFGGLTVPISVASILALATWRESFLALGGACFVVALLAWIVIREAPRAPQATARAAPHTVTTLAGGATAREALRSRDFYAILAVVTLGYFTYSTVLSHTLAHLLNKGMSVADASFALGTLALGGLTGKVVFGAMIDRYGARPATITNLVGQTAFAAMLALGDSPLALTIALPCFGLFMGGFGVVSTVLVQDSFGLRHFGSIMGLMNLSTVMAFGLGPLIAGVSFDHTGSYSGAFLTVAAFFATGALILVLCPLRRWTAD